MSAPPLQEFRCPGCRKLLARIALGDRRGLVQIRCPRCHQIAEATADVLASAKESPPERRAE